MYCPRNSSLSKNKYGECLSGDDEVGNVTAIKEFLFPKRELILFRDIMKLMELQRHDFDAAMLELDLDEHCIV